MILQADYIEKFRCDGKICGSRCCRDWKISEGIELDERGYCENLDDDYLCKLQKNFGEDSLPAICRSYPRITYKLSENIFTQSMTLTCPIAAQIILLSTAPINFVEVHEIKSSAIIDFTNKISYSAEKFLQVQMSAIKILQDREFSIDERLKNLCDFEISAENIVEIFDETYQANLDSAKKKILCRDYLNNRHILLQIENIFENYLVNEYFMRCYPCAFDGDDFLNHKIFITSFRVLEFCILLTAIANKNFNLTDTIIYVNDKLDHSKGGMTAIINFAENMK